MKNYDFGTKARPRLRLSHVEAILRATRVINPIPSRRTLIRRIEDGTLEGYKSEYGYYVFEDSFKAWLLSLHPEDYALIGAQPTRALHR
ncbi:MAG TPA: hypothetical protein VF659_09300 [Pyrinomonadaceae bacterium]